MSAFNIWVTEKCNLSCSYCYEDKKRYIDMDDEVLEKTVSFIRENMEQSKTNIANFHGGEPLLAIDSIMKIIKLCNKIGKFNYSLTTNGTIVNDFVLDELKKNHVYVSLSIDGTKEIHDFNRKNYNGSGTYNTAIKCLKALQDRDINVRVRMTVTPETVSVIYNSVMSIADLHAETIVAMIDLYDDRWTDSLLDVLKEQLIMIHMDLQKRKKSEFSFYSDLKTKKKGLCDGGITNFNISADGIIYPCTCLVNDKEYMIGSVFKGIDDNLLYKHKVYYDKRNITCNGCKNEYTCLSKRCKYINKSLTGEYLTASPIICRLEHIMHSIRLLYND